MRGLKIFAILFLILFLAISANAQHLQKGDVEIATEVGIGIGNHTLTTHCNHNLAMTNFDFGYMFTNHWEGIAELFAGYQFNPNDKYLSGGALLLRYNLNPKNSRWSPFANIGAGLVLTNIERPDLDGTPHFNLQAGVGTRYFIKDKIAIIVQYQWFHISCANIREPNNGVNTSLFMAGLSWIF
jgi:opacity protein-like surface antigen